MPRYFFDLDINGRVQTDTTGRELKDRGEAKKRADDVVLGLLRIWDPAQSMECACTVHYGQGGHIYRPALISNAVTPETLRMVEERKARRASARAARLAERVVKGTSGLNAS